MVEAQGAKGIAHSAKGSRQRAGLNFGFRIADFGFSRTQGTQGTQGTQENQETQETQRTGMACETKVSLGTPPARGRVLQPSTLIPQEIHREIFLVHRE